MQKQTAPLWRRCVWRIRSAAGYFAWLTSTSNIFHPASPPPPNPFAGTTCNMTMRLAQAATGLLLRDEQTLLIAYAEQAGGSVDTALLPARRQRPVCLRGPSEGWERAYAPGAPPEQRGSLPCGLRSAPHGATKMKRSRLPATPSASRASPHCRSRPTSPWTETRGQQAQHQEQQRSGAGAAAGAAADADAADAADAATC